MKIFVPANIRFKFYPTRETVKLENKFAAMPLQVPLCSEMNSSYEKIKKVTKHLKGSISTIYAMYALTYWTNTLLPRFMPWATVEQESEKFSLAFSNTPGPIKPFGFKID